MKKLGISLSAALMILLAACPVFADVVDPVEEAKRSFLTPVLLIAFAVVVLVLVLRSKRKK